MALTKKVTVTLPVGQVEAIKELVAEGGADSLSGFVTHAVGVALEDQLAFDQLLDAALEKTGGPMTAAETRWADEILRG